MKIQDAMYVVTMPDGSEWAVPVILIAKSRAAHYAHEFGGVTANLANDTLPLFANNPSEVIDWARGDMDWADVADSARMVKPPREVDFQQGWVNGPSRVEFAPAPERTATVGDAGSAGVVKGGGA